MHGPSPQLLALCAFLALCAVGIPVHWWPRWVAVVIAGRSQPEWATDPWIRRWIAEQELKQRTTALPGAEHDVTPCLSARSVTRTELACTHGDTKRGVEAADECNCAEY